MTFRLIAHEIVNPDPTPPDAAVYSAPLRPAAIKVAMVTEARIRPPAAEYAS